jgi:hypothetical protein
MCKATRSPTSAKATAVHGVLLAGILAEALRAVAAFAQVQLPGDIKGIVAETLLLAAILTEALRAAAGFAQVQLPGDIKGVVAETLQSQRGAMCVRSMAIKMVLALPTCIAVRETRLLAVTGEEMWQDRTRTIRNAEHTGTPKIAGGGRIEITVITKNTAVAIVPVTNIGTGATATITTTGGR